MPIIKSAKKRVRTTIKASIRNSKTKRDMRSTLKSFQTAVASNKNVAQAQSSAQSAIDTAVKKNIITKNKAARMKKNISAQAKTASTGRPTTAAKKPATKKATAAKPVAKKSPAKKAPAKTAADDLTKIEGVGPKIKDLLHAADIKTFQNLADAPTATVKQVLADAGSRYASHDPGTWGKQAKLAADGKFDELKTLQDKLDGGK